MITTGSMNTQLAQGLFTYRVMPQSTTGVSPAELLLHRQPRTRLDLLRPNTPLRVEEKQQVQKRKHDSKSKTRSFQNGDLVYVKNSRSTVDFLVRSLKCQVQFLM